MRAPVRPPPRGPMHFLLLSGLLLLSLASSGDAASVTESEAAELREEVREMFYHAFSNYMKHAFPLDELRPLSCSGEDSLGEYTLTLVDSLDMLALLGDHAQFSEAVTWLGKNLRFDYNKTVSVFETTIRVLGGLLSAHLIASDDSTGMKVNGYQNELLILAESLGRCLLPAFDTPTGIPYGSVNLIYGVSEDESQVTSTAGGGTLTLEFGILSLLTGDPVFGTVARNAVRGLWAQRSVLGLVGAHINVLTGDWTHKVAYLLFGDEEYLYMFKEAYKAVMLYLHHDPWYLEVNMNSAVIVWPLFNSLQAFWPGLQVLAGDIEPAVRTHRAFFSVWKKYGFTPEGFNLATSGVQPGQKGYPLRPELIESTYLLFKATRDRMYLDVGRDIVASLQFGARCPCGYCHIADVESHAQDDHMESFFLAETVKYLYLLFDLAAGGENMVENGPYPYIFSTEGHLFPMMPEISLAAESCSYPGSFCKTRRASNEPVTRTKEAKAGENETESDYWFPSPSDNSSGGTCSASEAECSAESGPSYRPIKGVCEKLTFWRRLGIRSPRDQGPRTAPGGESQQTDSGGPKVFNLAKSLMQAARVRQMQISISHREGVPENVLITNSQALRASDGDRREEADDDLRRESG